MAGQARGRSSGSTPVAPPQLTGVVYFLIFTQTVAFLLQQVLLWHALVFDLLQTFGFSTWW